MAREKYAFDYIFDWTLTAPIVTKKSSTAIKENLLREKESQKGLIELKKGNLKKALGDHDFDKKEEGKGEPNSSEVKKEEERAETEEIEESESNEDAQYPKL